MNSSNLQTEKSKQNGDRKMVDSSQHSGTYVRYDFVGLDPSSQDVSKEQLTLVPGLAVAVHPSLYITAEGVDGNLLFEWTGGKHDELQVGGQRVIDVCHAKIGTMILLNNKRYMVMKSTATYTPHLQEDPTDRPLRLQALLGIWSKELLEKPKSSDTGPALLKFGLQSSSQQSSESSSRPASKPRTWRTIAPVSALLGAFVVLGGQFLWNTRPLVPQSVESSTEPSSSTATSVPVEEGGTIKVEKPPTPSTIKDPTRVEQPVMSARKTEETSRRSLDQARPAKETTSGRKPKTATTLLVTDNKDSGELPTTLPTESARKRSPNQDRNVSTRSANISEKSRDQSASRKTSSKEKEPRNSTIEARAPATISAVELEKHQRRFEEAILIRNFDPDLAQQILTKLQNNLPSNTKLHGLVTRELQTY